MISYSFCIKIFKVNSKFVIIYLGMRSFQTWREMLRHFRGNVSPCGNNWSRKPQLLYPE